MNSCKYRPNFDCREPTTSLAFYQKCQLCLIGQLCDETSLNTRAIMNMSIDKIITTIEEEYE